MRTGRGSKDISLIRHLREMSCGSAQGPEDSYGRLQPATLLFHWKGLMEIEEELPERKEAGFDCLGIDLLRESGKNLQ